MAQQNLGAGPTESGGRPRIHLLTGTDTNTDWFMSLMLPLTNGASDLVVVGGAKQQVFSCWMPLNEPHPPGVTNQSLPGLG